MLDLLLTGGSCPDFEAGQLRRMNVGIEKGKIVYLGEEEPEAARRIDAAGKVVSPGFIDIHMHEENFTDEGKQYIIAELMLKMGVTTACGGNCGIQNQPVGEFRRVIEELGGSPVNYVMLAGYNQMRYELGLGHKEPLPDEKREELKKLLQRELAAGAAGISFGIEYDPGITFADMQQALELLQGDSRYLAAAHFREADSGAISSVEEMIRLAETTGVRFQISHLISCSGFGQMKKSLELIEKSASSSPLVRYDTYPYNAFATYIGSEVFEDESLAQWCRDISKIMLTEEPYKNVYCTKELLDKARKEYPQMLAVGFIMNEEEVSMAVAAKYGMIGSDGILNRGNGHPRAAGTFPRVLGKYVREEKALSLMEALQKITLDPAERLSLDGKGRIAEGADADITVFDPDVIIDGASYDDIYIQSEGIDYVIVGGRIAMDHKQVVDARAGRFIPFTPMGN